MEPMTLGNMREVIGARSVSVSCNACGHGGVVNCDRWGDELPVSDVVLYLRCSQCGSKDFRSRLNVSELYARVPVALL